MTYSKQTTRKYYQKRKKNLKKTSVCLCILECETIALYNKSTYLRYWRLRRRADIAIIIILYHNICSVAITRISRENTRLYDIVILLFIIYYHYAYCRNTRFLFTTVGNTAKSPSCHTIIHIYNDGDSRNETVTRLFIYDMIICITYKIYYYYTIYTHKNLLHTITSNVTI